tara:strand:- start:455 stop:1015 length:561 start_codon:yes stop_codon:yes gene_type:complete
MASFKINGKNFVTQNGTGEPTISSNVEFPAGIILKTQHTQNSSQAYHSIADGSEVELFSADAFTVNGSNKVLVNIQIYVGQMNNMGFVIKRDSTVIGNNPYASNTYLHPEWIFGSDNGYYTASMDDYGMLGVSITFLDEPNLAGTYTYRCFNRAKGSTGSVYYNRPVYSTGYGVGVSSFTLMEIKA